MPLEPGLSAAVDHTVCDDDTALALGSGDVPVLGTPRVLALLEQASVQALADALDGGCTSVGVRVEVDHLAATPVGRTVRAEAQLMTVDDGRLDFAVTLVDGDVVAASGRLRRRVVDRERFLHRL